MGFASGWTGIIGLILLVLNIWAIVSVIQSRVSTGAKVMWIVAILIFPLLGFIAWLIFGPRSAR
ncbi:PLDc N-terminal domain-containing protein [Futiania mangrovi]|uniref:PLDc N-terminal domain-containing protein n=1 Tax=Futiania mangrovi TaxID=2959716 RepID=A0A9J6PFJ4_9PROT|nr:PLDc N-terminal domain-containing protein [Futiania mangrovii]MCP1335391.1 PLDc N-terminal domain-containing protein [Futiania mangrovii]